MESLRDHTKTKFINSYDKNTPKLQNRFGSLNELLREVLVEGYNTQEVFNITVNTVQQELVLKLNLNHGFSENLVVNLSGNSSENLNGDFRVKSTTTDSVVLFGKTGVEYTSEANLNAKIKGAPLGFSIVFEDTLTGTVCYKNNSNGIIKVIDKTPPNGYDPSWAKFARVVMGNTLDDLGNFLNNEKTPYDNTYPDIEYTGDFGTGAGGIHGFAKWDYAIPHNSYSATEHVTVSGIYPTDWKIIGDDRTFYLMVRSMGTNPNFSYNLVGFGDYVSDNPLETTNQCLQARDHKFPANYSVNSYVRMFQKFTVADEVGGFLMTDIYGRYKNVRDYKRFKNTVAYLSKSNNPERPWKSTETSFHPVTGKYFSSPLLIKDSDNYLRGSHRGIKILYGNPEFSEGFISAEGDLVTYVQEPIQNTSNTSMPILFSLKDWL